MSVPKFATITASEALSPTSRRIELALADGGAWSFRGGQYIIVHTGAEGPEGKPIKRAYSLVGEDGVQDRVDLLVHRHGDGLGSKSLQDASVGQTLSFSGPWGKLPQLLDGPLDGVLDGRNPQEAKAAGGALAANLANSVNAADPMASDGTPDSALAAGPAVAGRSLVVATDTGITAALGLLLSQAMAPWRPKTTILWLREVPSPIPVQAVRQRLPDDCDAFVERDAAPVGDETRIYQALDLVADVLADGPVDRAFLMGDGHVLQAVKDTLEAAGVGPEAIRVENFFNAPKRA